MPPIVDAIFDVLVKLLVAVAIMAVAYRLLIRRRGGKHMDREAAALDAHEPGGPFLDPVPGLSSPSVTGVDDAGEYGEADDPGSLVTVASYQDVERAHLARIDLEQHGVAAFVADASLVGTAWWYSNAVHGVKVQVPRRHAEVASDILGASEHDDAAVPSSIDSDTGAAQCRHCGSPEVYRVAKGRGMFFLLLLVLSLALPVVVRRYQCDHCGATYRHWPVEGG